MQVRILPSERFSFHSFFVPVVHLKGRRVLESLIMDKNQNRVFHGLLSELNLEAHKADLVNGITNGRTSSSKELTYFEANKLIRELQKRQSAKQRKCSRRFGYLINMMKLMGYTVEGGDVDWKRINRFVENIGSRNPKRKKNIRKLTFEELGAVLTQVEAMYKKESFKS